MQAWLSHKQIVKMAMPGGLLFFCTEQKFLLEIWVVWRPNQKRVTNYKSTNWIWSLILVNMNLLRQANNMGISYPFTILWNGTFKNVLFSKLKGTFLPLDFYFTLRIKIFQYIAFIALPSCVHSIINWTFVKVKVKVTVLPVHLVPDDLEGCIPVFHLIGFIEGVGCS